MLVTDAIVLHATDYLESSRIFRLVTREAGVQSVLARGARTSRKRFGSAVDLFTRGVAHLDMKQGRDLHTLRSFDVEQTYPSIAGDLDRFMAAAAFSECVLRLVPDEPSSELFDNVVGGLHLIATHDAIAAATLGSLWRLVANVGWEPTLLECASCHTSIPLLSSAEGQAAAFNHRMGGVLCERCATLGGGSRRLPEADRTLISSWLRGTQADFPSASHGRAHQRLFREFLQQHLAEPRPLRAFLNWEQNRWGTS